MAKRQVQANEGRKRSQGASRRADGGSALRGLAVAARVLVRTSVVGLVLAGLMGAGYYGKRFVDEASQRPISSIGVEGAFVYIDREAVSKLVMPMIQGGFLQSPLPAIKTELEKNPWIAQAAVSRRWPDELYISIVEEQPIARWGKEGFLNHKGELIRVNANARLADLPMLSGNVGQEKSVMQNYQQLAQMLRPHGLKVSEFYSDELFSWNVVLNSGLKLAIGRDQTMEKIQRFLLVYRNELHERVDEVASVDLRYGNGVAVEWKTATAESADEDSTDKKA